MRSVIENNVNMNPAKGEREYAATVILSLFAGCSIMFSLGMSSCGKAKPDIDDRDVLLSINGKSLTMQDVVAKIPVGIEPEDSAALFHTVVDNWVEVEVLSELASNKLPDLEEIENKVRDYRNRLIVTEYLNRMKESQTRDISSDSVRRYYDIHKGELLTESPLVKGVYMKIPSNSSGIDQIRELIFRSSEEDIDRLEKDWLEAALQYDYFGSTWVDWETLANQIPYRFYDPDAFLKSTSNFETSYNGSTYFFHIMDYLPSGSEQPFEFASGKISAVLEQSKIASYEEALVKALVEKAIKDQRLIPGSYDPLRHEYTYNKSERIITTHNNEEN